MFPIVFNINDHKRCIFTIFFSSSEEHIYLLNSSVMKRINSDGPKFHQYQQSEQSSITSNYGTYKKSPQRTTWGIQVLHICSLEQV
jgi:hypothetical protein